MVSKSTLRVGFMLFVTKSIVWRMFQIAIQIIKTKISKVGYGALKSMEMSVPNIHISLEMFNC